MEAIVMEIAGRTCKLCGAVVFPDAFLCGPCTYSFHASKEWERSAMTSDLDRRYVAMQDFITRIRLERLNEGQP
jgi:hypothetical protein